MFISVVLAAMLMAAGEGEGLAKGSFHGAPAEQGFARWRLGQAGLEGGAVIALQFVDQNTVLAGTNIGAFRSLDGGMNWTASRTGLPEQSGTTIAADPNDPLVYFAGGNNGVFRSIDGGATWMPANAGIEFEQIRSVAVDPGDSDHVYAATEDDRFYFSTDGGASWNGNVLGLSGASGIQDIAVDPVDGNVVYLAVQAFDSGDQGIYKSIDGGVSFLPMNTGLGLPSVPGFEAVVIDRNDRNRLFAGASCGGVFRSTDAALNWTRVEASGCVSALAIDASDSQRVISNEHVSLDGGDSWQAIAPFADTVISVAIQPVSHTLYAGSEQAGLARSTDDGASWEVFRNGLDSGIAADVLAIDRDRLFAAVNRAGIFASTDGGDTWLLAEAFDLRFNDLAVAPSDAQVLYAGTDGSGVIASFDGGASWTLRNTGIENEVVTEIAVAPDDPDRVYAATSTFESFLDGTVYITSDGGMSWTRSGLNSSPSGVEVQALAINPQNPMQIFAGIADDSPVSQSVQVSNDGGQSWGPTDASIDTGNGVGVFALAIDPTTPATLYAATAGPDGVFKSIDSGATWTALAASGDTLFDLVLHPLAPNRLFNSDGLLSDDGGASWKVIGPNFPFHQSVSMNPVDPSLLYNPGFFGLYMRDTDESRIDLPEPDGIDFGDRFGSQVVVSGDTIIVGSPGSNDAGPDSGVVHVYRRVGAEVVLEQKISVPGAFTATNFGRALAVDGDRLLIGAPVAGGITPKGNQLRAAIFERLSRDWLFKTAVSPAAGSADDGFGAAVAIDGDMIAVGAPTDSQSGAGAGAVYVYDASGAQAQQLEKLTPPAGSDNSAFGTAIGMGGGKFAIGAPGGRVGAAVSAGLVSLYTLISGNLQPAGDIEPQQPADGDAFGASVALTGDMLVVGKPGEDGVVPDTGAVAVFEFDGDNVLAMGQVAPTVADSGSEFGRALSLRGGRLVVGAPMSRAAEGRRGSAFLFDAANAFALRDRFVPEDEDSSRFGFSVAATEDEIAIGAPLSNSETGSATLIGSNDRIFATGFEN